MGTKTHTEVVVTEYGEVETDIEIVECDSCNETVRIDEANEFTIGKRSGWACKYCADVGPAGYPSDIRRKFGLTADDIGFLPTIAIGWIVIPVCMIELALNDPDEMVQKDAMTGELGWVFVTYGLVALGLYALLWFMV